MKVTKDSQGFAALEAILVIIILAIVGFTGWFVVHSQKATDKTLASTGNSSTPKAAPKTTTVTSKDTQKYLEIKEWGIKFPLSSAIETAVYSSGQFSSGPSSATGGSAKLGLTSLGSDCGDSSGAPLGEYVEFTQSDVNEENVSQVVGGSSLHDLMKTAVKVPGSDGGYGGYYIAYIHPQQGCDDNTAALTAATAAFNQALKSMKSADQ